MFLLKSFPKHVMLLLSNWRWNSMRPIFGIVVIATKLNTNSTSRQKELVLLVWILIQLTKTNEPIILFVNSF